MATKFDNGQKPPAGGPKEATTLSTMVSRVSPQDFGLDSISFSTDVSSMRANLSKCTMSPHDSENPRGVNLENLVKNLAGVGKLELEHFKLGRITLYTIRTRKVSFIVSPHSPESLYEDPQFMSLATNLRERSVLYTQKGSRLFIYPLGSENKPGSDEIRTLQGLANKQNGRPSIPPSAAGAEITDTLQLDPEKSMAVSIGAFKERFARCEVLDLDTRSFDPKAFAEGILVVSHFKDEKGSPHYVIIAGKEEDCYLLYVNADSTAIPGKGIALGYGGNDFCLLYRDES